MAIRSVFTFLSIVLLACLSSCATNSIIVNDLDEREANEIVVFLASKGIDAEKIVSPTTSPGGGGEATTLWSITVSPDKSTEAMAFLNQNGLPRIKGTNLLELFAKQGFMSTEKEETIRYQAGLAEQIAGMIRQIDGVINATVQLSFPPPDTGIPGQGPKQRTTAAVYVKHQGILDDPNSHLLTKIKRLVAGSVNGLDINDVTVISDRSRFTDITLMSTVHDITPKTKEYVSVWSIVLSKQSLGKFRLIFFTLMAVCVLAILAVGWLLWKIYPLLRSQGGVRQLLNPAPLRTETLPPKEG